MGRQGARGDIADLIRLIRLVQARRRSLLEGGEVAAVATCDELLGTLRDVLLAVYPLRRVGLRVHVRR